MLADPPDADRGGAEDTKQQRKIENRKVSNDIVLYLLRRVRRSAFAAEECGVESAHTLLTE